VQYVGPCLGKLVKRYVDKNGESKCSGAKQLKSSQHYTPEFGRAVAELYTRHVHAVRSEASRGLTSVIDVDAASNIVLLA
jgi:hypothetical protein